MKPIDNQFADWTIIDWIFSVAAILLLLVFIGSLFQMGTNAADPSYDGCTEHRMSDGTMCLTCGYGANQHVSCGSRP